jgi:hypothetical protein
MGREMKKCATQRAVPILKFVHLQLLKKLGILQLTKELLSGAIPIVYVLTFWHRNLAFKF